MSMLSVIMSVYNEPIEWIKQSIDSILTQSFKDFEFIIVCDNPDYQEARDLLVEYQKTDCRILLIFNESNVGLTKSLNIAINESSGDYIARMDADDISMPNRFDKQLLYLTKNRNISVCYTNYSRINEVGECICPRFQSSIDSKIEYITYTNPVGHSTVMFRKTICQIRNPLYNENYRRSQDYELWSFLYLNGVKFGYIDEDLLKYRVSRTQVTSLFKSNQDSNLKQIRKYLIINYLKKNCIINTTREFSEIGILRSKRLDKIKYKKGDALFPIVYMLYYGASKQSYIYTLKYLFDGMVFKYGIKKTLYLVVHPLFKTRWDNYLI